MFYYFLILIVVQLQVVHAISCHDDDESSFFRIVSAVSIPRYGTWFTQFEVDCFYPHCVCVFLFNSLTLLRLLVLISHDGHLPSMCCTSSKFIWFTYILHHRRSILSYNVQQIEYRWLRSHGLSFYVHRSIVYPSKIPSIDLRENLLENPIFVFFFKRFHLDFPETSPSVDYEVQQSKGNCVPNHD